MKCKVRLWLLLLLFKIATSNGNGQSTTPRYTNQAGNILISQTLELSHAKPSNYTDYGRKLKRRQPPVRVVFGNGTSSPNYVRIKIERKNNTNPTTNKFVVSHPFPIKLPRNMTQALNKRRRVKLRPKVKIKRTTVAPKINAPRPSPPPPKKKTVIRNGSNHYKNYTKFRIKPAALEKQNPSPEITLFSPEYPIGGSDDSVVVDAASSTESFPFGIPVSQVLLQSAPLGGANDCPNFQLSSLVYGPQLKQNCPDLNIVINSQLSQNAITERLPEVQADPLVEDSSSPVAFDEVPADTPAAAAPAAADTNSGAGAPNPGTPGNPIGFPQLPELPGLPSLPDLKGLFDFLGLVWKLLKGVFGFLANPYLYLVPAGISFALGFLKVLSLVPWWVIPVAFYVARKKDGDDGKPEVAYYKHVHPPVHHYDEWFWNQNTKTWTNVFDYAEKRVDRKPAAPKLVRVRVSEEDDR